MLIRSLVIARYSQMCNKGHLLSCSLTFCRLVDARYFIYCYYMLDNFLLVIIARIASNVYTRNSGYIGIPSVKNQMFGFLAHR